MSEVMYREFTEEDVEEGVRLYQKVFKSEPWFDNDSDDEVMQYLCNFVKLESFVGYAAFVDNRMIALSIGFVKPYMKGFEYYLDQFCVDSDLQRQGIGSKFTEYIKRSLSEKNIHHIFLLTSKSFPSYSFYKKNDFEKIEGLCCMAN